MEQKSLKVVVVNFTYLRWQVGTLPEIQPICLIITFHACLDTDTSSVQLVKSLCALRSSTTLQIIPIIDDPYRTTII